MHKEDASLRPVGLSPPLSPRQSFLRSGSRARPSIQVRALVNGNKVLALLRHKAGKRQRRSLRVDAIVWGNYPLAVAVGSVSTRQLDETPSSVQQVPAPLTPCASQGGESVWHKRSLPKLRMRRLRGNVGSHEAEDGDGILFVCCGKASLLSAVVGCEVDEEYASVRLVGTLLPLEGASEPVNEHICLVAAPKVVIRALVN
mmetsp:Transcript_36101/g.87253  ORF Transcript_36101/g.87253 Transcript_36101/m.87253 type:complete len:201 (+) Transcript_36101:4039-4641(+)